MTLVELSKCRGLVWWYPFKLHGWSCIRPSFAFRLFERLIRKDTRTAHDIHALVERETWKASPLSIAMRAIPQAPLYDSTVYLRYEFRKQNSTLRSSERGKLRVKVPHSSELVSIGLDGFSVLVDQGRCFPLRRPPCSSRFAV